MASIQGIGLSVKQELEGSTPSGVTIINEVIMKIKCNNPVCEQMIYTNKSHITRIHKESGCKLYFCSDECDVSHKYIFNKNERYYFHKIADVWKKSIEKNFRKFYDFMPEHFFNFLKPIEEEKTLMEELEKNSWLYKPLAKWGDGNSILLNDVIKICKNKNIKL